jgi:hypothetical protein
MYQIAKHGQAYQTQDGADGDAGNFASFDFYYCPIAWN